MGLFTQTKVLTRHLTDDDIETFRDKQGQSHAFRVRIWQGKEATPVVLTTPSKCSFPSAMTIKVANWANQAVGYRESPVLYFEQDPRKSIRIQGFDDLGIEIVSEVTPMAKPPLQQAHFEYYGYNSRLRMFKPMMRIVTWEYLETIVGESIER